MDLRLSEKMFLKFVFYKTFFGVYTTIYIDCNIYRLKYMT